jgi:hypothetical protein
MDLVCLFFIFYIFFKVLAELLKISLIFEVSVKKF